MTYQLPSRDRLPELIELSRSFKRGIDLDLDVNKQIGDLLGVPIYHYTVFFDAALKLRDAVYAGQKYLNIDIREYNVGTDKEYFLVKLDNQYSESNGDHHTRAGALLAAIISHVVMEVEGVINE